MASASSQSPKRGRLVPRFLEPRVDQLRRDLRALLGDLRGVRAPTWEARDGSRFPTRTKRGPSTRTLEVVQVEREAGAVSLSLRDPSGAALEPCRPGQFFTLILEVDGVPLRRAYSISSDCRRRDHVRLTIKRVADGRMSSMLYADAEVGMRLEVLGPSGKFGIEPEPERSEARELVLIAGGSGITPMMALLHTLLPSEPNCRIALVYANRSQQQVIHATELAQLVETHAPRFELIEILEQPPTHSPTAWNGHVGQCSPELLATVLDTLPLASGPEVSFLLCGPPPMMDGASALLEGRGVAPQRIQRESFLTGQGRVRVLPKLPRALTVISDAGEFGLTVKPGQTLLDAGLDANLPMPYSCTLGGCGACMVQLERGEVDMPEANCLSAAERERGTILACIAKPRSACRIRLPGETS